MENSMGILITVILLVGSGIALIQVTNSLFAHSHRKNEFRYRQDTLMMNIVVVGMYLVLLAFAGLMYLYSGRDPLVVYFTLALFVLLALGGFLRFCFVYREDIRFSGVVLFALYFGGLLYVTLFSRLGARYSRVIDTAFQGVTLAIQTRSWLPLEHMILNVILFLPCGYLIPNLSHVHFHKVGFALIGGIMVSTVIEGIQMVAKLGTCELDDIIANAIGAVIGYCIWRFIRQVRKRWAIS